MQRGVRALDVGTAWTASVLRFGLGLVASHVGPRPAQPVRIYDFEGCPFCRKVREALTMLDLSAMILPCPKGGPRYRAEVIARGGQAMFPYLIDPNTDTEMYESAAIVRYLYEHYGNRSAPFYLSSDLSVPFGSLASAIRLGRGVRYRPAKQPEQPLELYGFDASPYVRLVRETLSELELAYTLHPVGKRSPSRSEFIARSGKMMVPWLADPNTGTEMFESADIRKYLLDTYAE